MRIKEIKVWTVECCPKKIFRHKSSAVRHLKNCAWNPDNKSCLTCARFKFVHWCETEVGKGLLGDDEVSLSDEKRRNEVCSLRGSLMYIKHHCDDWKDRGCKIGEYHDNVENDYKAIKQMI